MSRISESNNDELDRNIAQDIVWSIGLRATAPRIAIVETLYFQKHPISIEVLHQIVKKTAPRVNVTSIYRTLEALIRSEQVRRIDTGAKNPSYEMVRGKKHHHHIICTVCGNIEDINVCPVKSVTPFSENFSTINDHSLEFFGLCRKCDQ